MSARLDSITFDAVDPVRLAHFWAQLLERERVDGAGGALLPGTATQVGLRFASGELAEHSERRLHLHVTSARAGDQQRTVARALALGATHLDVGQRPEEDHVVLADPEGNELCIIERGNAFLAGCGFLGEVACDGTRDVGVFWSAALGWPLVWDHDGETAIQSWRGGTKVAWGGPPITPKQGRNRQRFDLAVVDVDLAAEVDRLVGLGATATGSGDDREIELLDPDGNEFRLCSR